MKNVLKMRALKARQTMRVMRAIERLARILLLIPAIILGIIMFISAFFTNVYDPTIEFIVLVIIYIIIAVLSFKADNNYKVAKEKYYNYK